MNRTVFMGIIAAFTALVLTATFLLGTRGSTSNTAVAGAASEGSVVPLGAAFTPQPAPPVAAQGTPSVEEIQQQYQQQLEAQVEQIRQMYQKQLEEQLERLRQEYERQLQEQTRMLQQQWQQESAPETSSEQLEALRQRYEAQIQALQAAWQQREQAYQAQLQEAIRRLEIANSQIQALQQRMTAPAPNGPGNVTPTFRGGSSYESYDDRDDDDDSWEYRGSTYREDDDEWEGEWDDD